MSVPDQYAGKRVRCPGCQAAQRVPMPAAEVDAIPLVSQPIVDLSALDAIEASGVRRLRQILIGCGECQKTIKIPESKIGKTTACTSCGVILKVDSFNLAKAKGDLIDMTHLELEKADLLLDGGSHGSTLGGSSIQLDGSGTGGYELNVPPSGSMSGVSMSSSSQSQMRELRELNDLKHSGQISSQEYRERKKEIYAGKTLAIQAMSRSADGSGNRPVIKRDDKPAFLPGPVKLMIVVLVLAGGGYAAWAAINGPQATSSDQLAAATLAEAVTPATSEATTEDAGDIEATATEAPNVDALLAAESHEAVLADAQSSGVDEVGAVMNVDSESVGLIEESVTMFEIEPAPIQIGEVSAEIDAPAAVRMTVADWSTSWPTHTLDADDRSAIGQACEVLQRISVRDDSAIIGVAVGPAASDLDSAVYRGFRQEMQDILTETAQADQVLDDLNIRTSERTAQLGTLESHRLHVTSKTNREVRATILTGIQDGHCVSYWFAGSKTLYTEFLDTVGRANLASVQ